MSVPCSFCGGPVNPHDIGTWKRVQGWVHGPKADSMTMREYTGEYAHDHCVKKAKTGQAPDQPDMFKATPPDYGKSTGFKTKVDGVVEELFGENNE